MVRAAAAALDAKAPTATLDAAMAKRFATDACFGVANDALQVYLFVVVVCVLLCVVRLCFRQSAAPATLC